MVGRISHNYRSCYIEILRKNKFGKFNVIKEALNQFAQYSRHEKADFLNVLVNKLSCKPRRSLQVLAKVIMETDLACDVNHLIIKSLEEVSQSSVGYQSLKGGIVSGGGWNLFYNQYNIDELKHIAEVAKLSVLTEKSIKLQNLKLAVQQSVSFDALLQLVRSADTLTQDLNSQIIDQLQNVGPLDNLQLKLLYLAEVIIRFSNITEQHIHLFACAVAGITDQFNLVSYLGPIIKGCNNLTLEQSAEVKKIVIQQQNYLNNNL